MTELFDFLCRNLVRMYSTLELLQEQLCLTFQILSDQ